MTQTRVVIVDDHPLFRQGLRDVLETDPRLEVVGEAASGGVAIQLADELDPHVMLMDINLPDIMGLQATRQITADHPDLKVIVVTGYDDAEQALHAIRSGAAAYCPKDITPEKLISTIQAVQENMYVINERVMTHEEVLQWVEEKVGETGGKIRAEKEDSFISLSPREMEILEHVTMGMSNKEIAFTLGISHQTVKNHMTAILRKLRVDDRTQAAVFALSRGWVRLDKPLGD